MTTASAYPGTCADDASVGSIAWNYPTHVQSGGSTPYAYAAVDKSQSHYLKSTNFGFAIPSGATINGITCTPVKSGTGWASAMIVKAGTITGTNQNATLGGSTNLWGTSWTYSDINNSGFGVALSTSGSSNGDQCTLQSVALTVDYSSGGLGGPGGPGTTETQTGFFFRNASGLLIARKYFPTRREILQPPKRFYVPNIVFLKTALKA